MNANVKVGNIASDLELKQTPGGVSVLRFTLAVKRPFKKDVTDFFRCVAWRGDAENISRYFKKGDYIAIKGFDTTGSYTKKVGGEEVKIPTQEIQIQEWDFCGSRKSEEQNTPSYSGQPQFEEIDPDGDVPF